MALLDRFRRSPRTAPAPKLDVSMAFVMGQDGRIRALSEGGAIKSSTFSYSAYAAMLTEQGVSSPELYAAAWVSSVWANRCVNLIADNVNRLEWFVQDKETKKKQPEHPLMIAIKRNKQKIIRKHIWAKFLWGEIFIVPLRNAHRYYSDLRWLNNLRIDVDTSIPTNVRVYYNPNVGTPRQFVSGKDIAFMYTDNPFDDYRGLSPFETVLTEIGIDNDVSRATRAFYANDTRIGLMLIPENDIPEVQAQTFMDYWKANFQGAKNAGKPVLMPRMIKEVKEIQRAPIKDDVEIRESMRREICALFGVPLSVAGAWDDANYQSAPEQRRSFYEEKVMPEAEMLATDWNTHVLPFFVDDAESVELAFDNTKLLALTENVKEKSEIANARLISGGLSVNEYRKEQKLPELPNGDVLYVPNNVTVTKIEELGKKPEPPPQLIQSDGLTIGQTPKPSLPSGLTTGRPVPQLSAGTPKPVAKAVIINEITEVNTPEMELAAWRKKAMNGGVKAALKFICYALPKDVESGIRGAFKMDMDKAALNMLFDEALDGLKKNSLKATGFPVDDDSTSATPEEYQTYWQEYDRLQAEIGDDWLQAYMGRALASLEDRLTANISDEDIQNALMTFRDELVSEWVGTKDAPGVLTRMTLAGMAAGNQSLVNANSVPNAPQGAFKAFLGIDWGLLAQDALNFAARYVYDLIFGIDATTIKLTREAITNWIASGDSLDSLKVNLTAIFKDPVRAAMISQTEATRIYAEGANLRWLQAGVHLSVWKTVRDNDVCKICDGLHNVIGDFVAGWKSRYDGKPYRFPAHPRCRCFPKPLL